MSARVVLVTGASTGMGHATAALLHARGWIVYGVSRSIEQRSPQPPFFTANVDVTKEAEVAALLERIAREAQRLDAVVNCAGYALAGSVEETSLDAGRAQLETNFLGAANVCRLALPLLRAKGRGHLVNVSSIAGHVPMAFQGYYSASKAALTAFTRALRLEVFREGVHVCLIEPGDFATNLTAVRRLGHAVETSRYPAFARTLAVINKDESAAAPPNEVAELIVRTLEHASPRASYLVGPFIQRLAVTLRALVPQRLFDWVLTKLYDL